MILLTHFERTFTSLATCVLLIPYASSNAAAAAPVPFDSRPHSPVLLAVEAILGAQPGSLTQDDQQTLTNEDVIKMVRAHLGVDVVLEQIKNSRCKFSLTTNNLIGLKQAGVPDSVITAMQAKMSRTVSPDPARVQNVSPATSKAGSPSLGGGPASNSPGAPVGSSLPPTARQIGQPGGAETFDLGNCPNLSADAILALNGMRLLQHALDDDRALRLFVLFNNQCENQFPQTALDNELDYPRIAKSYKEKASEILAGAPSEITVAVQVNVGEYNATLGGFPVGAPTGPGFPGSYGAGPLGSTPSTSLFPFGGTQRASIRLRYAPFEINNISMSESEARQFIADMQKSYTGNVRIAYLAARIEIFQTPPKVLTNRGVTSLEFAGRIKEVSVLEHALFWGYKNPPIAVLHPDPTADDTAQQAEAFFYKSQYSNALPLSDRSCTGGDPDGCGLEGLLYALGLGVTADPVRGMMLMSESCSLGDAKGCDELGMAYLKSLPAPENENKALPLFKRACDGGLAIGCVNEADISGFPGQQQYWDRIDASCKIGIDQFAAQCNSGYAKACSYLGRCYNRGAGVNPDKVKAKQFFQQACSLGDEPMCKEAARMR